MLRADGNLKISRSELPSSAEDNISNHANYRSAHSPCQHPQPSQSPRPREGAPRAAGARARSNAALAAALSCASGCRERGVIAPLTRIGAWILRPPRGPQPQEESSGRELGPPSCPSTPHAGLTSGSPETLGSTTGEAQVHALWPRCTADLRSEQGGHDEGLLHLRSAARTASPSGSTSDPKSPAAHLPLGQTGGRMGGRATGTWDWTEDSTLDSWILNL